MEGAVLIVNLEHTAQRKHRPGPGAFSRTATGSGTMGRSRGPRSWAGVDQPRSVSGRARLSRHRALRDELRVRTETRWRAGRGGAYRRAGIPVFTTMQGTADVSHGRARFWRWCRYPGWSGWPASWPYFVKEVSRAPVEMIDPAGPALPDVLRAYSGGPTGAGSGRTLQRAEGAPTEVGAPSS